MGVAAKVKIFTRATSLGGVESLIEHRASVEHPGTRTPDDLLRVSIGLEHVDDLIEDLNQALVVGREPQSGEKSGGRASPRAELSEGPYPERLAGTLALPI